MRDTKKASGRFLLRVPPALHAWLRRQALDAEVSLNEYCTLLLSMPMGSPALLRDGAEVVQLAVSLFGEDLVGVLVFGSWTRGEAGPDSDVDVLIVVARDRPLTRDLYRLWDRTPMQWQGRRVETHFVHPPQKSEGASGVWAEAAIDGLLLFEREFEVSRSLIRMRQQIAGGHLLRKTVHGQPYWAEAP